MTDRAATMRCLLIGDIIGKPGRLAIEHALLDLRRELEVDFVIANGENVAAGAGLTHLAEALWNRGSTSSPAATTSGTSARSTTTSTPTFPSCAQPTIRTMPPDGLAHRPPGRRDEGSVITPWGGST